MERGNGKKFLIIAGLVVAAFLVYKMLTGLLWGILSLVFSKFVLPVVILGGICWLGYRAMHKDRALGDGRRGRLPRL